MIIFSCSCGMKFKVKDEFAGRHSTCPTCKQAVVVPLVDKTQAYRPTERIEGLQSSVARAGMDGGITVGAEQAARGQAGSKSVRDLLAKRGNTAERYLLAGEIARGGMGAVLRAIDCDIRREVAVKYLLDQSDPWTRAHFVEEAQITGQLEHPNIVPIHELGIDAQQQLFFTMKMVKGRSLAQVLEQLRQDAQAGEKEFPLSRLLNVFVGVCNALAYAHACSVVHRDLKPANIMVGDFGEVYVMDWGLAKVMGQESGIRSQKSARQAHLADEAVRRDAGGTSRTSKVSTSREATADLTQDGSILGTPLYMSPEQANGQLSEIDARSDIYALGVILYEMLALDTPVDREGGFVKVLVRVGAGELKRPHERAPERHKAGKIPPELAAVAMKALAIDKRERYPSVEALRRDIELFQEGRSVSAKDDTFREVCVKLIKRNKGTSITTAAALLIISVILVISFISNYRARVETQEHYAQFLHEQEEKRRARKESVPAFLRAARLSIQDRKFEDALAQANVALDYEPTETEARLLKGQLLIIQQKFAEAQPELEEHLKLQSNDPETQKLLALCRQARPGDTATLLAFATEFTHQKAYLLADGMLQGFGENVVQARNKLLDIYRKRIDDSWPGLSKHLNLDTKGRFNLTLAKCTQVADLGPLQGMPLVQLNLAYCKQVRDLTPLRGMQLSHLNLLSCQHVRDLTPLRGMPLTMLTLGGCDVQDLAPLKGMPVTSLQLHGCGVQDLAPLQGMPLTTLDLGNCAHVRDLAPLKGMPLTTLNLVGCSQVRDLTHLQGMNLTAISLKPRFITKGMDVLREMQTLTSVSTGADRFSPEEFWKKYDAGEFKK